MHDTGEVLARYGLKAFRRDGDDRFALALAAGVTGRMLSNGTPYPGALARWLVPVATVA